MITKVTSTFSKGVFQQELSVSIPPFVGKGNQDNSADGSTDTAENAREIDSLLARYPVSTPSKFDAVATANNNTNTSPITVADNSFSGNGLKVDLNAIGARTTIAPEKPNSAFGVANDEQTYSGVSSGIGIDGGREA
jgi:hypothetical protein